MSKVLWEQRGWVTEINFPEHDRTIGNCTVMTGDGSTFTMSMPKETLTELSDRMITFNKPVRFMISEDE